MSDLLPGPQEPPQTDPPADETAVTLLSEALQLVFDVSKDGARNLDTFLSDITGEATAIADKAGERLSQIPRDKRDAFATRGGRLANDAVSVALDVALAAKEELVKDPAQRDRILEALSQVVGFVGSMFIDSTNRAVGTAAGGPSTNRTRQVTVALAPGEEETRSAWVVNRGPNTVVDAPVRVLHAEGAAQLIKWAPHQVTVPPGRRIPIELTVTAKGPVGSFSDALLVVEGIGSIVVRTIVKQGDAPEAAR